MINQLMMIKLVRLRINKCDWLPGDIESSSYELRSALFERGSLVSTVQHSTLQALQLNL